MPSSELNERKKRDRALKYSFTLCYVVRDGVALAANPYVITSRNARKVFIIDVSLIGSEDRRTGDRLDKGVFDSPSHSSVFKLPPQARDNTFKRLDKHFIVQTKTINIMMRCTPYNTKLNINDRL